MNDIYGEGPLMSLGNRREGKATKLESRYRLGGDHCGVCAYYIPKEETNNNGEEDECEGTCVKVEGLIREDDLCDYFLRAGDAKHEEEEKETENDE